MRQLFDEGTRKAIAIDASYISKSGKKTPYIGKFWSGCASQMKRGLEILGIGIVDVDQHECMMLRAEQTPDKTYLEEHGKEYNRDSKQFTGLNDCQARDLRKLDFAFNASLASVNIAKVMRKQYYPSLSIGLLKAYLSNIYIIRRI
ncbi:hypothetical protein [Parabacteroides sp.]